MLFICLDSRSAVNILGGGGRDDFGPNVEFWNQVAWMSKISFYCCYGGITRVVCMVRSSYSVIHKFSICVLQGGTQDFGWGGYDNCGTLNIESLWIGWCGVLHKFIRRISQRLLEIPLKALQEWSIPAKMMSFILLSVSFAQWINYFLPKLPPRPPHMLMFNVWVVTNTQNLLYKMEPPKIALQHQHSARQYVVPCQCTFDPMEGKETKKKRNTNEICTNDLSHGWIFKFFFKFLKQLKRTQPTAGTSTLLCQTISHFFQNLTRSTNFPFLIISRFAVPEAIENITVDYATDTVILNWTLPVKCKDGGCEWSSFTLSYGVTGQDEIKEMRPLSGNATSDVIGGLTPGESYDFNLNVLSYDQSSEPSNVTQRTRKSLQDPSIEYLWHGVLDVILYTSILPNFADIIYPPPLPVGGEKEGKWSGEGIKQRTSGSLEMLLKLKVKGHLGGLRDP